MPPAKKAKLVSAEYDAMQYDATIKTRVYLVVVAKEFAERAAAHSKEIFTAGGRNITAAAAIKMFKEDYPVFAYFEAGKVQSTKFYFLLKTMYKYCLEIAHADNADVDCRRSEGCQPCPHALQEGPRSLHSLYRSSL